MSRTLNLADRLLDTGRRYHQLGRIGDALHLFHRLCGLRELPDTVAEEAQLRQAEILLHRGQFARARRHLVAALAHDPANPRYYYLLATAQRDDEMEDPQRALESFRKSLELDPGQPRCRSEFGLLALSLGQVEEGLEHLRRAAGEAPDDEFVLTNLLEGLAMDDRADEAQRFLRAGVFRNPGLYRRQLNDFRFQQLWHRQQISRARSQAVAVEDEGPVLLPFARPPEPPKPVPVGRKRVRRDGPSPTPPPHPTRPARLSERRHA